MILMMVTYKTQDVLYCINPQTTVWGPLDPAQHSDSCKRETENDLAEIFQVTTFFTLKALTLLRSLTL